MSPLKQKTKHLIKHIRADLDVLEKLAKGRNISKSAIASQIKITIFNTTSIGLEAMLDAVD